MVVDPRELGITDNIPLASKGITEDINPQVETKFGLRSGSVVQTDVSGNFNFDQNAQENKVKQSIIQQIQKSADGIVTKKATDNTIISGTSGASTVQAVQNTKADIVSGKQQPGFFDGIAGFIGDFAKSEAGTTLLSGLAGQAVGRDFGVSDTAGFLQGAKGGMTQITKNREAADVLKATNQKLLKENTLSPKEKTDLTLTLGDKAITDNKNYAVIRDNMTNIEAVTKRMLDNPEGSRIAIDQATIISFNKILDPTSVVRESEYERTPGDAAWFNRAKAAVNRIKKGGKLDKSDILEIRDVARAMEKIRRRTANTKIERRRKFATDRGLKADEVAMPYGEILSDNNGKKAKGALPDKTISKSVKDKKGVPKAKKTVTTSSGNKFTVKRST